MLDPSPDQRDLLGGQMLAALLRRHLQLGVVALDPEDQVAIVGLARHNRSAAVLEVGEGTFLGVEPELGLACLLVRPVAGKAIVREQRPDIPREPHRARRGRGGRILRIGVTVGCPDRNDSQEQDQHSDALPEDGPPNQLGHEKARDGDAADDEPGHGPESLDQEKEERADTGEDEPGHEPRDAPRERDSQMVSAAILVRARVLGADPFLSSRHEDFPLSVAIEPLRTLRVVSLSSCHDVFPDRSHATSIGRVSSRSGCSRTLLD